MSHVLVLGALLLLLLLLLSVQDVALVAAGGVKVALVCPGVLQILLRVFPAFWVWQGLSKVQTDFLEDCSWQVLHWGMGLLKVRPGLLYLVTWQLHRTRAL